MAVPYSRLVKEHGLDHESLKKAFDRATMEERPKVKALVDQIRDTIQGGIERNRRDYRLFKAMDWAFEAPFYQVSYTQLKGLVSAGPDDKKVMETVNSWGLTHLLADQVDGEGKTCCGVDGKPKKSLNVPVFFNIFVPLVMAYITIRLAKLFNDLDQQPHFKYEPAQFTKDNRLRAEMITQLVERQSKWFGYPADTRQTLLQTLLYGVCINFPKEAWFQEKQEDENGNVKTVREGLRFDMPHPSRTYYDTFDRLSTLNTNSGIKYAGHWSLPRYKDVHDNPLYWNKDRIAFGATTWFDLGKTDFLSQVYPCTQTFPEARSISGGVGPNDREANNAAQYYSSGEFNNATLTTNHFQQIIPADHGLGTYKYPVWFRFVLASEDTVLYAEPLSFDRLATYAYDADFNRDRFRSMALEIVPFQDHLGNLLSHWILAVKQNLSNPILYDKDQIPATAMAELMNMGQKTYSGNIYVPFSSAENYRPKVNERSAFHQPQFARHNTGEIAALASALLAMLDRLLLVSPQETGQAASHEQTAEESRIVDRNMSTRVRFTGSFIRDGNAAKKKMLYDAIMAHADDDITANISSAMIDSEEEFKKTVARLGMTIADGPDYDPNDPKSMRTLKGKKSAIALEEFASTLGEEDRINTAGIAAAMSQVFTAIASNEVILQTLGPAQVVELLNQIIVTSGLPREFRLKANAVDPNAGAQAQQEQLQKLIEGFAAQVKEALGQAQQQTLDASQKQTEAMIQEAMGGIVQQLQPIAQAVAQGAQVDQQQQAQIEALATTVGQVTKAVSAVATVIAPAAPGAQAQPTQSMQPPAQPQQSPLAPVTLPA